MSEIYNNPHTPTPTNHEEARKKQEKKKQNEQIIQIHVSTPPPTPS